MAFWDDPGSSGWAAGGLASNAVATAQPVTPTQQVATHWDDSEFSGPDMTAYREQLRLNQDAHTKANLMSRGDFIKKYGTTFVADDKGGNAASEVAGSDVGAYYDQWLDPNRAVTYHNQFDAGQGEYKDTVSNDWVAANSAKRSDYADANPYFDAWDNVNPHPTSQADSGWFSAWRQIGRPAAAVAATYLGLPLLAGAVAPTAAAGTAGSAGIGSGTVLGGGAATGSASGLAGMVGMAPGLGATALNSGALSTGMSLVRGKNIGDALKDGVVGAALSPVGTFANNATTGILGNTFSQPVTNAIGTVVGNAVKGGAGAALTGQNVGKGILNGAVNGVVGVAGNHVGGWAKDATDSKLVGNVVNGATQSVLRGNDPLSALVSGGVSAGTEVVTSNVPGFLDLDPQAQQSINTAVSAILRGKSPTQALIDQATNYAINQVGAQTKSKPKTRRGW